MFTSRPIGFSYGLCSAHTREWRVYWIFCGDVDISIDILIILMQSIFGSVCVCVRVWVGAGALDFRMKCGGYVCECAWIGWNAYQILFNKYVDVVEVVVLVLVCEWYGRWRWWWRWRCANYNGLPHSLLSYAYDCISMYTSPWCFVRCTVYTCSSSVCSHREWRYICWHELFRGCQIIGNSIQYHFMLFKFQACYESQNREYRHEQQIYYTYTRAPPHPHRLPAPDAHSSKCIWIWKIQVNCSKYFLILVVRCVQCHTYMQLTTHVQYSHPNSANHFVLLWIARSMKNKQFTSILFSTSNWYQDFRPGKSVMLLHSDRSDSVGTMNNHFGWHSSKSQ